MSTPKFTPGPWSAEGTFVEDSTGTVVADCDMGGIARPMRFDNARLIAAAPDFYKGARETIDECADCWDRDCDSIGHATLRVALAKAGGK